MNITDVETLPKKPPKKQEAEEMMPPVFFTPDQSERFVKAVEAIAHCLAKWQKEPKFFT